MSSVTKVHWLILLSKQDNGDATAVFRVKFFCWCGWFARCWLARPLHLFSIVSLSLYGAISRGCSAVLCCTPSPSHTTSYLNVSHSSRPNVSTLQPKSLTEKMSAPPTSFNLLFLCPVLFVFIFSLQFL